MSSVSVTEEHKEAIINIVVYFIIQGQTKYSFHYVFAVQKMPPQNQMPAISLAQQLTHNLNNNIQRLQVMQRPPQMQQRPMMPNNMNRMQSAGMSHQQQVISIKLSFSPLIYLFYKVADLITEKKKKESKNSEVIFCFVLLKMFFMFDCIKV